MEGCEAELSIDGKEGTEAAELLSYHKVEQHQSDADPIESDAGQSPRRQRGRRVSYAHGEGKWLIKHHNSLREMEKQRSIRDSRRGSSPRIGSLGSFSNLSLGSLHSLHDKKEPNQQGADTTDTVQRPTPERVPEPDGTAAPPQAKDRNVRFSTCTFRYYETILGDNPFCSSGPSLSLGWNYDHSIVDSDIPVDYIEEMRSPQGKSEWDLMMSRAERERRLLDRGYSREKIAKAVKESNRIKNQRVQTILNLRASGPEEFAEGFKKKSQKALRIRKSSSHLYREWEQGTYRPPAPSKKQVQDITKTDNIDQVVSFEPTEVVKKERSQPLEDNSGDNEVGQNNNFGVSYVSPEAILMFTDDDNEEEENDGDHEPFAIVDTVFAGSPADEAGFQRGDKLLRFGCATRENSNNLKMIGELTLFATSREKSIPAVVFRDGSISNLTIRPRSWEGRGNLGFLLRPYEASKST